MVARSRPRGATPNGSRPKEATPDGAAIRESLDTLKGLSAVLYGATVAFLLQQLLTYANVVKAWTWVPTTETPFSTPYLLNIILIYLTIEAWRVANTDHGHRLSVRYFLFDIVILAFIILSFQTFMAGITGIPQEILPSKRCELTTLFAHIVAPGCAFLAITFLMVGVRVFRRPRQFLFITYTDGVGFVLSAAGAFYLYNVKCEPWAVSGLTISSLWPALLLTIVGLAVAFIYIHLSIALTRT